MTQVVHNILFFLVPGVLIFTAVSVQRTWLRALAGSVLLIAWLSTSGVQLVKLGYHSEATEALIREMDRRRSIGQEMLPDECLQDAVLRLDRNGEPLSVFLELVVETRNL